MSDVLEKYLTFQSNWLDHLRGKNTAREAWQTSNMYHEKSNANSLVRLLKKMMNIRLDEAGDMEFWRSSYAVEKERIEKTLEEALTQLEEVERKQNESNLAETEASTKDEKVMGKNCFRRQGKITAIHSDHGIIDTNILFNLTAATMLPDLRVGFLVSYLAYQTPDSDYVKIIRIEQILNDYWDVAAYDNQKHADPNMLCTENPEFFNIHQRSFLGQVINKNENFITVDTDYDKVDVDLDTVTIDYSLQLGDQVYLICNVQTDQAFVDSTGEILDVVSVHAARSKKLIGLVTSVNADQSWGLVNNEFFFSFDILSSNYLPSKSDRVSVHVVESERGKYAWRCTNISLLDRHESVKRVNPDVKFFENKNGVVLTDNFSFRFANLHEQKSGELVVKNESDEIRKIIKVCFLGRKCNSQLKLTEPNLKEEFALNPGESKTFRITARAQIFGYSKEILLFKFDRFKIAREIFIEVGECDHEVNENMISKSTDKNNGYYKKDYNYAHQVWSKKSSFVPGVYAYEKPKFIANRIGPYECPARLRNAVLTSKNLIEMSDLIEDMYPCLTETLSYQNYCPRFQTLLYLEEIEYFLQIRHYDRERAHFARDGEYLALHIDNLSERRPSLMIGDTIRVSNPWAEGVDKRCYEGVIHKVLFDRILLKFNAGFQSKYNGEDYCMEFYFSRFSFRKQHYALKKVYHQMGSDFLFPSKIHLHETPQLEVSLNESLDLIIKEKSTSVQWNNKHLNDIQKMAIKNILRGEARPMPYVIFGPPGTGKTLTLIETILKIVDLLPDSRLLIGTPSNSSADLIATRLIESKALKPGDFIRLVSQNLIEKDLIPEHLRSYCATIDIAMEGTSRDGMIVTESGLKLKCQLKHMGRHRITIGTCMALGGLMQMGFPKNHFTHILVDEAGQCTETELAVLISLIDQYRGQVILAGDPLQLGPIILNKYALEKGLGISFLQRIVDRMPYCKDSERYAECGYDSRLVTKLVYNYRALPSILKLYNDLFYDSELKPMVDNESSREASILLSISDVLPGADSCSSKQAVFFFGIRGENKQDRDSPSWYNPAEAKSIFLFVLQLYKKGMNAKNIGIITPYQKQVKAIRNILIEADIMLPKIGSVEEFQGQERDIILVSTVRSRKSLIRVDLIHSLGFVQSDKRLNVAISRARALLVIFGNPHLLSLDKNWERLIKYCIENNAYTGCDLPSSLM